MEVDTGRAGPTLDPEEVVTDISMLQDSLRHFTSTAAVGHLDDAILLTKMLLSDLGVRAGTPSEPAPVPEIGAVGAEIVLLQEIFGRFTATGDHGYLEDSIRRARVLLADLQELRRIQPEPADELEEAILQAEQTAATTAADDPRRGMALIKLGAGLNNRYAQSGVLGYLEQAIRWAREALDATPPQHTDRAHVLSDLAIFLYNRYAHVGTQEDLEEPIRRAKEAVAATPEEDQLERAGRLNNLSIFLQGRYERFGAMGDLEKAIEAGEEALTATPQGHHSRLSIVNNMGNFLQERYSQLGVLEDLENGIKYVEEAAAATPPEHPHRASVLQNLSDSFHLRYSRFGAVEDLQKAIEWAEEALAASPLENPERADRLHNLGVYLHSKHSRLGALEDLQQAIQHAEAAVAATPPGHHDRGSRLQRLGSYLQDRYVCLGTLGDLEQAIERAEQAVEATPGSHPDRAGRLSSLGTFLHSKYTRLGALEDLQQAIRWAEAAIQATPLGHLGRAKRLSNLGVFLESRYARLGLEEDLERVVKQAEEALAAIPADHCDRPELLHNLANSLHSRYSRFGALGDLEQAIRRAKEALEATPPDHPVRATMLHNLGRFLHSRDKRMGALEDLEQAINRVQEALEAAPSDDAHRDRADILANLGNRLFCRYERFGALGDLEQAITRAEQALAATPLDHPDRASRLNNLGDFVEDRYTRLGAVEDLELSISQAEAALDATPLGHRSRGGMLSNLSVRFRLKYMSSGAVEDLEKTVSLAERALEATPADHDHPDWPARLNNLGAALRDRYALLGAPQDRQQAIRQAEAAAEATPPNHPNRAGILTSLGGRLLEADSQTEFDRGIDTLLKAWHSELSPPRYRIFAARFAALALVLQHRWQEAASLLEGAVKLLTQVSPRFLGRDDQEYMLSNSQFSGLAADGVAIALQAGAEPSHCLGIMELGRGIIMGLAIDCRSDLSELEKTSPELFGRFSSLRLEIDSAIKDEQQSAEQYRHRRVQAIKEMEHTLASVRELPGFAGFQLPPASEDLMVMAAQGPIVVFNTANFRSDAIIITSSSITALPLPKLVCADANDWMQQIEGLVRGKRSTYPARNRKMADFLLWLWDVAVEPVLDELSLDPDSRIWWIGVGPLAMAPFHAAGDHSAGSTRNTLDRAVSSYIPTIKALSYAREKPLTLLRGDSRLLLVTMPTTPGNKALTNAAQEANDIGCILGDRAARLDRPSAAQVLENLPSYQAIHFACHGVSDIYNPSGSHLLLRKADGTLDHLPVRTIASTSLKHAQLAYLSACCTATNASRGLADESIHIASAFQLAGFSHVLATLWESSDDACRRVAADFYSLLFGSHDDGAGEVGGGVARAYGRAVRRLREQNRAQPLKWASFIHTGA